MDKRFVAEKIAYTGKELASHWIYHTFGLKGDSIVCFQGSAQVGVDDLVDLEDARQGAVIYSQSMLHFMVEHFDLDLEKAVLRQRLLVAIIGEEINNRVKGKPVKRINDDLYEGEAKLSVSIATISPVSTLIHTGININSQGTPVETKGLNDYQIEAAAFGQEVMERYVQEIANMQIARSKVKAVR